MTKEYTITLTDIEDIALGSIAVSQQEWIDNAVHEICRITIEKITKETVLKCMEQNIEVPTNKEAAVLLAMQHGWLVNPFSAILLKGNT